MNTYQTAHTTAILVDRSELGMLKFPGESRLDLINRMSTNKVIDLKSGEGKATVLTTDIGRSIDRITMYAASDAVYVLTGENYSDPIARYLMRFVFFNDDFQIEDVSAKTAIFGVYGKGAQDLIAGIFSPTIANLPLHHWQRTEFADQTVYVHRTHPVAGNGYFVMCGEDVRDGVWDGLVNAGISPATLETFNYLRIESGLPRFGTEISQDYIPLETGLWDDVSFTKGCYIGQEIIARMESRGKVAKQLVRLQLDGVVEGGSVLRVGGKNAGILTSIADGEAGVLGLAYLKTKFLDQTDALQAGDVTARLASN
jgi:aminomethyltransferase